MAKMTADAPLSRLTQRLVMSGERMTTLLDDLLHLNRTSLGSASASRARAPTSRRNCTTRSRCCAWPGPMPASTSKSPAPVHAHVDASRIREALANLVNNAVKHGGKDGDVHVTLEYRDADIVMQVDSLGSAIPAATLSTMFDPLRHGSARVDEGASLGLGLFVVREVAKAHGGDVTVSCVDDSTTFTMRLPREPAGQSKR